MTDVAARRAAGAADAARWLHDAAAVAALPLGRFHDARTGALLLRRSLLALHVPPAVVAAAAGAAGVASAARFASAYAYWSGVRAVVGGARWRALTGGVVVLTYHACGYPHEPASAYVVPGARFGAQLRWLARRGYRVCALDEYLRRRAEHRLPEPRTVVITFDDAYRDTGEVALPALRAHGFPATVFVVTRCVGARNGWDGRGDLDGRALAGWGDLLAMADSGVTLGAHTRTHRRLVGLDDGALDDEVAGSRADLAEHAGAAPAAFAYPGGLHDAASRRAVLRAGFAAACTTDTGVNDPGTPAHLLRRTTVRGDFSRLAFAWAVRFGTLPPWWPWTRAGRRRARAGRGG